MVHENGGEKGKEGEGLSDNTETGQEGGKEREIERSSGMVGESWGGGLNPA